MTATRDCVQIIEKATGRITREEPAGGLTPRQQQRLVRNLQDAVVQDGKTSTLMVRIVGCTTVTR